MLRPLTRSRAHVVDVYSTGKKLYIYKYIEKEARVYLHIWVADEEGGKMLHDMNASKNTEITGRDTRPKACLEPAIGGNGNSAQFIRQILNRG